jgi:hypothetical protein
MLLERTDASHGNYRIHQDNECSNTPNSSSAIKHLLTEVYAQNARYETETT